MNPDEDKIRRLVSEIKRLKKKAERELSRRIAIEKENKELKKRLRFYEGPNTPPSKLGFKEKPTDKKEPKKLGAPVGHPGVTRKTAVPNKVIDVGATTCPHCRSPLGKPFRVSKRIIEEIPEPLPVEVVQYNISEYDCPGCGKKVVARNPECPRQGRFGVRFLSLIVFLQIFMRGVSRKIPSFLEYQNGVKVTPATCSNILERIAGVCQQEYDELKKKIRKEPVVYVDETSISVMGKTHWIWVFRAEKEVVLAIRASRGSKVLEEILGKEYNGVVVCDGWSAYNMLRSAMLQRCWAHLIREAKEYACTVRGKHLFKKLTSMFKEIKAFKETKPIEETRKQKYDQMTTELDRLIKYYRRYPELHKILTYLENGGKNWFTCLLYENVEPTNNNAEQALREMVTLRNIIGAIRSQKLFKYENTCSLFATWKLKKENTYQNLKKIITQKYCMS
jgi:transposase